jgi:CheY-like chemotaxis protein
VFVALRRRKIGGDTEVSTQSMPATAAVGAERQDDVARVLQALHRVLHHAQFRGVALVVDGVEAMSYLRREAPFAEAPRPHLVLLDLNLPRKDGRQVLAEMKADPELRRIPVVVLTTSQAEQDVNRSYDLHANCYITKPVDLDRFITVVRSIEEYWCSVVTLPPR